MGDKVKLKKKKSKWKLGGFSEDETARENIGSARIEICGNTRITVDGCLGVYEYRDTYLRLRLTKGTVILCGIGFNIVFFENVTNFSSWQRIGNNTIYFFNVSKFIRTT